MLQKLYIHVFRWVPGETLTCEIKFGHKKIPTSPKPESSGINLQHLPKQIILLGAINVRVWFKHKIVVINA